MCWQQHREAEEMQPEGQLARSCKRAEPLMQLAEGCKQAPEAPMQLAEG